MWVLFVMSEELSWFWNKSLATMLDLKIAANDGYRQEEGIDYDEVFAPVIRIEAIKIFLAFASYMGSIVYQMDVKSALLYGTIDEEVYMSQHPSFVDHKFPKKVYKVVKALYGLHQALRSWYATLFTFLLKSGYRRGTIDKTLFIKKDKNDIMLVQVYVDDIIFVTTKRSWCDEFEALMKSRFQMRSMGELIFFLGLQVKQKEDCNLQKPQQLPCCEGGSLGNATTEDSTKIESMKLEAMVEERRIFKCWFHYHTTNGHQFTMSNRHQELASPEQTAPELASPKQTALGKDISNPLIVDSLLKTIWLSMHHVIAMKHWLFQSKRLLARKIYSDWDQQVVSELVEKL
ncbi:putative ribonuclease H-like domain-containing protein [Tanacetum coccineum]